MEDPKSPQLSVSEAENSSLDSDCSEDEEEVKSQTYLQEPPKPKQKRVKRPPDPTDPVVIAAAAAAASAAAEAEEAARLEALTYIPVPEWLESKESLKANGCRIFQTLMSKNKSFLCLFCVCSWSVLRSVLGLFWVCFGSVLGLFWVCFGSVLGCFGSVLGLFWVCFGSFLGLLLGHLRGLLPGIL